ncbi:MAG: Re/Si-specific NAD(P)(+) transhydrogenase subunit alpha [Planctomycetota bacterium]|nr:MAG: Re/Si-specific NAD(P)(+) transhydrogenase subunit alpha [Planctomycetota bacterium]
MISQGSPKLGIGHSSSTALSDRTMKIGVPKETHPGERRVAATPDTAGRLREKLGFEVHVQSGAGASANYPDAAYEAAGCIIHPTAREVFEAADILLKVRPPNAEELEWLTPDKLLIGFLAPAQHPELLDALAQRGVTALAMEAVPRISRAQKMDALSSMANIAGYRAVIEAAYLFDRFFTGQVTAAGKVPPAKVLVIGAGVAGLSAIGAARGLGAIVRAFDVRPEVADQVKSMGAEFLMLEFDADEAGGTEGGYAKPASPEFIAKEMDLFARQAKEVDIIITTALIPGRPAPRLITREMVETMRPGSIVVDLAAEQGGNCEVTQADQVTEHNGVHIVGFTDLPSRLASTSSQLYGTNLYHVLEELGGASQFKLDLDDEVLRSMAVVHEGQVHWPPPPIAVSAKPKPASDAPPVRPAVARRKQSKVGSWVAVFLAVAGLVAVGLTRDPSLLTDVTVFVLACVVGWQVIWNVTPALHTPLMSVTNAISGIIIIGGLVQVGSEKWIASILGALAIFFASINIAGGFLVTQRMLRMFRK